MSIRFHGKGLPEQFTDLIEREILAGEVGPWLPGYRTLMQRYETSAKTTLAAIDLLESRGVISAPEQGKRRRILAGSTNPAKRITSLLIVRSNGTPSGEDLQQIQAYKVAWEDLGGRVGIVSFDFPRYRRPDKLLGKSVSIHRADAILLHVPPLPWVQAAARLCPVFLSGGEHTGAKISGVAYDIRREIAVTVARLRSLGHERVMVPTDLVGPGMLEAVQNGLAEGLSIPPDSPAIVKLCPVFPEKHPSTWQSYWQKAFTAIRPTAVVLLTDIHVLSLYGYCLRAGIVVPEDLSVICLENTQHLEWCFPVPTRMQFPVKAAARNLRNWHRGGCQPTGMRLIPLEWVEGASLARAKAPGATAIQP